MSDIQEEQKRLYKRAEENDLLIEIKKYKEIEKYLIKENEILLDRINKAVEYMSETLECNYHGANITFDELIHNTINILQGSDK